MRILALSDDELAGRLTGYVEALAASVRTKDAKLQDLIAERRWERAREKAGG